MQYLNWISDHEIFLWVMATTTYVMPKMVATYIAATITNNMR